MCAFSRVTITPLASWIPIQGGEALIGSVFWNQDIIIITMIIIIVILINKPLGMPVDLWLNPAIINSFQPPRSNATYSLPFILSLSFDFLILSASICNVHDQHHRDPANHDHYTNSWSGPSWSTWSSSGSSLKWGICFAHSTSEANCRVAANLNFACDLRTSK